MVYVQTKMNKNTHEKCHKTNRLSDRRRKYRAKFKIEEDRCKQWIAIPRNEDLIYVPFKTLQQLQKFKEKRNKFKRKKVPIKEIDRKPFSSVPSTSKSKSTNPSVKRRSPHSSVSESDTISVSEEPQPASSDGEGSQLSEELHEGFRCNNCQSEIIGFRYSCVQCADFDLCGACEARRAHRAHYVLRVPAGRPQSEVSSKLQIIRRALLSDRLHMEEDILDEPMDFKIETIDPTLEEHLSSPERQRSPEPQSTLNRQGFPELKIKPLSSLEPQRYPEPQRTPECRRSPEPQTTPEPHRSPEPISSPEPRRSPEPQTVRDDKPDDDSDVTHLTWCDETRIDSDNSSVDHTYQPHSGDECAPRGPSAATARPSTTQPSTTQPSRPSRRRRGRSRKHACTPEPEVSDFEEIEGFRGDKIRWFHRAGQFYIAHRRSGSSTYLRCHVAGCAAQWTLRLGRPGALRGEHNHEPTPWVRNRNLMFQALKQRCTSEATPLHQIYNEEAARYLDAAPHLKYATVVSSMRTWRRRAVKSSDIRKPQEVSILVEDPKSDEKQIPSERPCVIDFATLPEEVKKNFKIVRKPSSKPQQSVTIVSNAATQQNISEAQKLFVQLNTQSETQTSLTEYVNFLGSRQITKKSDVHPDKKQSVVKIKSNLFKKQPRNIKDNTNLVPQENSGINESDLDIW